MGSSRKWGLDAHSDREADRGQSADGLSAGLRSLALCGSGEGTEAGSLAWRLQGHQLRVTQA